MERLTHEADFGLEDWEETLFFVKSDPNGAYNILDIAKYQGESEFDEILKNVALRLAAYENTGLEPEEIKAIAGLASENCTKTADAIDKLLQDDAELKSYRELGSIDRLRELAQADRDGRCVVLPCKKGDTVWRIVHDANPHITKDRCTELTLINGDVWVRLIGDMKMGGWNFGKLLFLSKKEAESALRREQDG